MGRQRGSHSATRWVRLGDNSGRKLDAFSVSEKSGWKRACCGVANFVLFAGDSESQCKLVVSGRGSESHSAWSFCQSAVFLPAVGLFGVSSAAEGGSTSWVGESSCGAQQVGQNTFIPLGVVLLG